MTTLDLWNTALSLLPHDRRVDSENDDTTEALRCRDHYERARMRVLTSHPWGFLTMAEPVHGCETDSRVFAYTRPIGALKVLGLYTRDGRRMEAEAINGALVTRTPAHTVRWLRDEKDPDKWPAQVQDAVALELAARICPVITANPQREAALKALAAQALSDAWLTDSEETAYQGTDGKTYLRARQ